MSTSCVRRCTILFSFKEGHTRMFHLNESLVDVREKRPADLKEIILTLEEEK